MIFRKMAAVLLAAAILTAGGAGTAFAEGPGSGGSSSASQSSRLQQVSGPGLEAGGGAVSTAPGSVSSPAGGSAGSGITSAAVVLPKPDYLEDVGIRTGGTGSEPVAQGGTGSGPAVPADNGQAAQAAAAQATQAASAVQSGGRTIDPNKPMVALTYDDGPYAQVGNRIMDCAEQYGGRVTFYVVGERVPSYRTEIKRMYDNGHEIGNHTQNHKYLNKLGAADIRSQVEACNSAVEAITGARPATMRLPGGNKNQTVLNNISQPIILWSVDTLDWKTRNAESTVQAVLNNVKDGDIVLMHELYNATADATVRIIPELVNRGFQLVTVSELAKYRGGMSGGKVYYSFHR